MSCCVCRWRSRSIDKFNANWWWISVSSWRSRLTIFLALQQQLLMWNWSFCPNVYFTEMIVDLRSLCSSCIWTALRSFWWKTRWQAQDIYNYTDSRNVYDAALNSHLPLTYSHMNKTSLRFCRRSIFKSLLMQAFLKLASVNRDFVVTQECGWYFSARFDLRVHLLLSFHVIALSKQCS